MIFPANIVLTHRLGHSAERGYVMQVFSLMLSVLLTAAPVPEGRGVWCHPRGIPNNDWESSAKLLADNGLNMIFPLMSWGGLADYASDVLPRGAMFRKHGDQLEQCCAAAKKHGLAVHVWKVNYNLDTAPKQFVEKLRSEGRTQVNVDGKPFDWLCPSHPENRKLELEAMLEVARKYPVDGLHFDYIRYPGGKFCYCDGCRARFEADSGRKVADWPKDCHSGSRKAEYNDWRCRQITMLVEEVSREARRIRPGVKISAAVFGAYPDCRASIAQDWPEWVKAGHLDFICPMDYTNSDERFEALVRNQAKLVGERIPLYIGIGAASSASKLSAERVMGQISIARSHGAKGFVLFNFNADTAKSLIPELGKKLDSKTAPSPLVPNADFTQGGDSPEGWTLSGGKGRWVDRNILEVTGTGDDSNQWHCKCRFEPGRLYRFEMRARGGSGAIAGPPFANRDYQLSDSWNWHGHVFRAPDGAGEDILRIGQWHGDGSNQYDAVRLAPVAPVHKIVGNLRLGDGESIREGQYHFRGDFEREGSNYHRPLESATAGFNSNRWCFAGNSQVTYRFALPGHSFRSGKAGFVVNYHERGSCTAEVGRDGKEWRTLVSRDGLGLAAADLPADLFPAENIYLRLRPDAAGSAFQVNGVGFSGELTGTLAEGEGQTLFAETESGGSDLAVEDLAFDDSKGADRPEISITVKNSGPAKTPVKIWWRNPMVVGKPESNDPNSAAFQAPLPPPGTQPDELAPGQRLTLTAETTLEHPGRYLLMLGVRSGENNVFTASIPLTLPDYYRADYGRRIEGAGGAADVWWCEADWKVAPNRPLPQETSPAATLSAARDDREAVQVVVRPTKDLRGLTAVAGSLSGPDGATIPAENIKVIRVYYHRVQTPTDATGVRDEWPDALPPLDKPLDVPAGRNQPLWVLIHVPRDARPGDYAGNLTLKAEGWSATAPLRLHVWNFALPERNHVETAFGLNPTRVFQYHRLTTDADRRRVWDMYMQNFAEHRISPYDPTPLDPIRVKFLPEADPPRAELDFSAFDAAMLRTIEKYRFTNFRLTVAGLGGGRSDSRVEPSLAGFGEKSPQYQAMFGSYVKQVEDHLREKGWLKMPYIYWYDEPEPSDYAFVRAGMERLKKYAPGLTTMLTEQPEDALAGPIDLWCPVSYNYNHDAAERRRAAGERFWWYVCCGPRAPFCTLFIDHPATELRVWLWQTWQRNIDGVLVWESNYWDSYGEPDQNPYEDPMAYVAGSRPGEGQHWGNGDGRFLYPPLSVFDRDAGDGPVVAPPVSSIRWEMLREGIEDFEYLWLLRELIAKRRGALPAEELKRYESLLEVPESITRDMTTFATDPAPIYARRQAVAEAIERLME